MEFSLFAAGVYVKNLDVENKHGVGADAGAGCAVHAVGEFAGDVKGGFAAFSEHFKAFAEAGDYAGGREARVLAAVEHGAVHESAGVFDLGDVAAGYLGGVAGVLDFIGEAAFAHFDGGVFGAGFGKVFLAGFGVGHGFGCVGFFGVLELFVLALDASHHFLVGHLCAACGVHVGAVGEECFLEAVDDGVAVGLDAEFFHALQVVEHLKADLHAHGHAFAFGCAEHVLDALHDVGFGLFGLHGGVETRVFAENRRAHEAAEIAVHRVGSGFRHAVFVGVCGVVRRTFVRAGNCGYGSQCGHAEDDFFHNEIGVMVNLCVMIVICLVSVLCLSSPL